jgi:alpha-tubulin suppressor-like RCC1 family protein
MDVENINCGSSHSLALVRGKDDAESVVVSWGRGEDGQLGHGDPEEADRPKAIFALFGKAISDVHCGAEYSLAVSSQNSEVYSWGWGDFGRLGHADSADVFVPTPIASLSGRKVTAVACGDTHTLVILDGGRLVSFGRNQNGQLGNASTNDCYEPQEVRVVGGEWVTMVACGAEHSACCTRDGKVYSWGWGRYGNIGDGDTVDRHEPVLVKGLDGVKIEGIACGWRHSLAIVRLVTSGWRHTMAVTTSGKCYS